MSFTIREPGHNGPLVSLGGVVDESNQGRNIFGDTALLSTATRQLLPANSRRIAAIINNTGADDIYIFGAPVAGGTAWAVIKPGGMFQIDENYPWTGEVSAQAVTTTATVFWSEVSCN